MISRLFHFISRLSISINQLILSLWVD